MLKLKVKKTTMQNININEYISLLKQLISTPSLSKNENRTADILYKFLSDKGFDVKRILNNIYVSSSDFDKTKKTILLNSHHDTVKAVSGWTTNPFFPVEKQGKLIGLGSNDAGASVVSLIATFVYMDKLNRNYNLIFAATAEEEISGQNGMELLVNHLGDISFAIVGEPTQMQMAIAEKGLMVIDCLSKGISGHAARNEGENAIYEAIQDINWFRNYKFEKKSNILGDIKMTVSQISAGYQHNVIPDECSFVVDIRSTDKYSNVEILDKIKKYVNCDVKERSTRLNSSGISIEHPFIQKGIGLGLKYYGSPTLSDQTFLKIPSLKIGPGKSERSHTANEFIYIDEIKNGIEIYIKLLKDFRPLQ